MGGLSWTDSFDGPDGGKEESPPDETGRSPNALGAVGGGLLELLVAAASAAAVLRLTTDPKAGADGATGGGETSLPRAADSCEMEARASVFTGKPSRSPRSRSSRGSRRASVSG